MKEDLCNYVKELMEFNRHGVNDPNIPDEANNELNILTVKQLVHFTQIIESGKFQNFDYRNCAESTNLK